MRIAALVWADPRGDFCGAPSALADDLAGTPVLTRTLNKLAALDGLDSIIVAAPPNESDAVKRLAGDLPIQWVSYEPVGNVPAAVARARAFGRYGWRGGLAGTTSFDELFDPTLMNAVLTQIAPDAVMLIPAGAALMDVGWAEAMLADYRRDAERSRLVFSQAPIGLAPVIFSAGVLGEVIRAEIYPGKILAYDPNRPVRDPIAESCNFTLPDWVIATQRRFTADCPRGLWLCRRLAETVGLDADGETICRAAAEIGPEPWPRELTVELTTRRPLVDDLRPSADRGDLDLAALDPHLAPLAAAGDVNVMFAGCGDALLHPGWPAAVAAAKRVGRVGAATYGIGLTEAVADQLVASDLDVLQVYVDAVSEDVYAAHKTGGSVDQVWAGIELLTQRRQAAGATGPFIVPTMLKTAATLAEQDDFFERCLASVGWGLIQEPTTAAGQWPDRRVAPMAPPTRTACRRIALRLTVLANGRVALCDEDVSGAHLLGESVGPVWDGDELGRIRQLHAESRWGDHQLCAACEEFHRP